MKSRYSPFKLSFLSALPSAFMQARDASSISRCLAV